MMPRLMSAVGLFCCVCVFGCQKLQVEKALDLDTGDVKEYTIDAPRSEQKVKVKVTSSTCPISGYLVLESNAAAVRKALSDQQKPKGALASADRKKEFTLEATIPGGASFTVFISDASKATRVELKASGS